MIGRTEKTCVFLLGGTLYTLLEMLWRGYSHPSMTVVGGICFLCIHMINRTVTRGGVGRFIVKCVLCGAVITLVELISGIVLNLWLGLDVWDYSSVPMNFLGQICAGYSAAWVLVSIPALWLCGLIEKFFGLIEYGEKHEKTEKIQKDGA